MASKSEKRELKQPLFADDMVSYIEKIPKYSINLLELINAFSKPVGYKNLYVKINVTNQHPFVSACKILCNFSCKAGQVMMNSFSLCLFRKLFVFPSILKGSFAQNILVGRLFSFTILVKSCHSLLLCMFLLKILIIGFLYM